MKKIIIMLLGIAVNATAFSSSIHLPSVGDLWRTAEVVISTNDIEIELHEDQRDLPSDRELEYERVKLRFIVDDVLKGSLQEEDDYLGAVFYIASKKDTPTNPKEEYSIWGSEPYLDEGKSEHYLVFLRRNVFGKLEPVHKRYFLVAISRGYEI